MSSQREYRQLLFKIGESSRAREARKFGFRESRGSLVLGALSTAIGAAGLCVLGSGMLGRPILGENRAALEIMAIGGGLLGLAGIVLGKTRSQAISPLSTLGSLIALGVSVGFWFITTKPW